MLISNLIEIVEEIYRSSRTLVLRRRRRRDGVHVILKTPVAKTPDHSEIVRYRHEFHLLKFLASDGVVRAFHLEEEGGRPQLMLEDIEGKSLGQWMSERSFTPYEVVGRLIQAVDALRHVHDHAVVHKDISPANLIWSEKRDHLEIIDFDISTPLTGENSPLKTPDRLEGTLLSGP